MNPPFAPENNLFAFKKSALVLYVEKSYNAEINDFIKLNHKLLVDSFNAKILDNRMELQIVKTQFDRRPCGIRI